MAVSNRTTRDLDLERLAHEGAVKLEITSGIPTWEAFPGIRHQAIIFLIQTSIAPLLDSAGCDCAHYSDIDIRFQDGSIKRPDVAIFCARPPMTDEAVTVVPDAVVEVISPGYEFKDIELNPRFYLAQGVKDLIVVDPRSGGVTHHRATGTEEHQVPVTIELQCGCSCAIPGVEELG